MHKFVYMLQLSIQCLPTATNKVKKKCNTVRTHRAPGANIFQFLHSYGLKTFCIDFFFFALNENTYYR